MEGLPQPGHQDPAAEVRRRARTLWHFMGQATDAWEVTTSGKKWGFESQEVRTYLELPKNPTSF